MKGGGVLSLDALQNPDVQRALMTLHRHTASEVFF